MQFLQNKIFVIERGLIELNKSFLSNSLKVLLLVIILLGTSCHLFEADNRAEEKSFSIENLRGQTVRLIVPHGTGGGYDIYARLIAPYIENHTGATVVVDNIGGAAGVPGRNEIWYAKPDGFTIGLSAYSSLIMNAVSELEAARYNVEEFSYLGRLTGEPTLIIAGANSNVTSIEDLQLMHEVKYGEPSVVDDTYFNTMVFGRDHGINFLPVTGYEGTGDLLLAMLREEFVVLNRSLSNLLHYIEDGDAAPLVINGFDRAKELPGVPTMLELAVTDEQKKHAIFFATIVENSRGFFAPPGLSPDILQTWQDVIEKVLTDPDLLKEARMINRPVNFLHGTEVTRLLHEAIKIGEELKPLIKVLSTLAQ